MIKPITDVAVYCINENNKSLTWKHDGFRYHINLYDGRDPLLTTLYKNPPLNPDGSHKKRNDAGYFDTRRLNGTKTTNRQMIVAAMEVMVRDKLMEKAIADHEAKEKAEHDAILQRGAMCRRVKRLLLDMKDAAAKGNPWYLNADSINELIECCGREILNNEFITLDD